MTQGGVKYVVFFRSAMEVAVRVLRDADRVQLRRDAAEVGDRREHPIDGEAFQTHQDAIDAISGGKGFVLGIYVYSDATSLSWSGGSFLLHSGFCLRRLACAFSACPRIISARAPRTRACMSTTTLRLYVSKRTEIPSADVSRCSISDTLVCSFSFPLFFSPLSVPFANSRGQ